MSTSTSNGQTIEESAAGMKENVANLAYDFVSLGELQSRLFFLDLQETGAQATRPATVLVGAACVFLGTIPVLLLGIGGLIASNTLLSLPVALLLVAGVALLLSAVAAWFSAAALGRALKTLERSRAEFRENLDWIKRVIQQSHFF
jgi:hypothetical protein